MRELAAAAARHAGELADSLGEHARSAAEHARARTAGRDSSRAGAEAFPRLNTSGGKRRRRRGLGRRDETRRRSRRRARRRRRRGVRRDRGPGDGHGRHHCGRRPPGGWASPTPSRVPPARRCLKARPRVRSTARPGPRSRPPSHRPSPKRPPARRARRRAAGGSPGTPAVGPSRRRCPQPPSQRCDTSLSPTPSQRCNDRSPGKRGITLKGRLAGRTSTTTCRLRPRHQAVL